MSHLLRKPQADEISQGVNVHTLRNLIGLRFAQQMTHVYSSLIDGKRKPGRNHKAVRAGCQIN